MSFWTDLRAYLAANAGVSALVGTRIHPGILPQNPALPALTYRRAGGEHETTHDGPDGIDLPNIHIGCCAGTYLASRALADAVRIALNGKKITQGGTIIQACFLRDDLDAMEAELGQWWTDMYFEMRAEEAT